MFICRQDITPVFRASQPDSEERHGIDFRDPAWGGDAEMEELTAARFHLLRIGSRAC